MHIVDCSMFGIQKINMATDETKWLQFHLISTPFCIYADFEFMLPKINSCMPTPKTSCSVPFSNHIPCGYSYAVVDYNGKLFKPPTVYRSEDVIDTYSIHLLKEEDTNEG